MIYVLTFVHVIVCLFLVAVVLLQQGKSADWAGTFGGGSSQAAFGQRTTATLLSKATTLAAILFMVTSLALTILAGRVGSGSVLPTDSTAKPAAPAAAPATPANPATPPAAPTSN
jgi:preprotein translocase subunit SecG